MKGESWGQAPGEPDRLLHGQDAPPAASSASYPRNSSAANSFNADSGKSPAAADRRRISAATCCWSLGDRVSKVTSNSFAVVLIGKLLDSAIGSYFFCFDGIVEANIGASLAVPEQMAFAGSPSTSLAT